MRIERRIEELLRDLTPQVLGAMTRRYGSFDLCEDAVQEALLAAATQWPEQGLPDNPRAWLFTAASRRLTDQIRSDSARRRREANALDAQPPADRHSASADEQPIADHDDSLVLLFLCCHPALTPASQIALTLRSVGGLTTAQIASAFFVPETTMAQRITRAKQRLKEAGAQFSLPEPDALTDRLAAVLHVIYLVFNEGYATTSGPQLMTTELTDEAIRLTRALHRALPRDGEVSGLLALLLLTEARRAARTDRDGAIIPVPEQDRTLWNRELIDEGVGLVTDALARSALGPYQVQAAIAAVHDEAPDAELTDWVQILGLYAVLESLAPNPMVTLNRAVAVAMIRGPRAGLTLLDSLDQDGQLARSHRLSAVRGHLLELDGDYVGARAAYLAAARRTTSGPEKRYLETKARRLLAD